MMDNPGYNLPLVAGDGPRIAENVQHRERTTTMDVQKAANIILNVLEGAHAHKVTGDPGGLTKYGITERSYPHLDIRNLTYADAAVIFETDFWVECKCNELLFPLNVYVADAAFNQGTGAAKKMLQKAIGTVAVDGILGRKTHAAIERIPPKELAARFNTQRQLRYFGTRNFDRFGEGWLNRVNRLTNYVYAGADQWA